MIDLCPTGLTYVHHLGLVAIEGGARQGFTPRGATQFPGLIDAAKALGVHRNHLYLVLSGRRVSHSLTERYAELKGGQAV